MSVGDDKPRLRTHTALTFGAVAASALLLASGSSERTAQASPPKAAAPKAAATPPKDVFRNGEAGFVVTEISYVLGSDAKESGACPAGMTAGVRGLTEALAKTPAGTRKDGETQQSYERRLSLAVNTSADGQNICMNPAAGSPDPGWRMVTGRNLKVDGIDLDGGNRSADSCSHEEFQGTHGERGIDNQFYRVAGCTTGFQSTGQANIFQIEMYTGSWGILLELTGVDDLRNDPDVQVGLFANADPIQLSAARAALPFATYAADHDPRYRATTRGRIVNGVLTIDPVDVRFHTVVNSMTDDRDLRGARLRLTFTPDGGMEGYLAGYTPVENMYDYEYGSRHSKNAKGELAPERLRVQTSIGRAGALGHTCNGAYQALYQAADGNRDPKTGRCTSISTQYRIRVAPAFVVNASTKSVNAPLTLK
ncbi:MAG: hypothetical protein ABIM50_10765 [Novosphingobium sp.]